MSVDKIENVTKSVILDAYSLLSARESKGLGKGFDSGREKVLFVLFDAGETKALQPVMQKLEEAGRDYRVLSFGTSWMLMKEHPRAIDIFKELGVSSKTDQRKWPRERPLSKKILSTIGKVIAADLAIVGMVSTLQQQIAQLFKSKGAAILCYYDGFAFGETEMIQPFLEVASRVLVPSEHIARSMQTMDESVVIDVVGQPVVEYWLQQAKQTDLEEIKSKLPIDSKKPLLIYISGYGEGYLEAFTSFVKAIQYVDHFHIGLSLHPKMDGALEKEVLAAYDCPHVFVIPKDIETFQAVALADLVVAWRSTVGVQAAFLGKPVVYLDLPGSSYRSLAIEQGWALQLCDPGQFLKLLVEFADEKVAAETRFVEGGVPKQAVDLIFHRITKHKRRHISLRKPLEKDFQEIFKKSIKFE